MAIVQSNVIQNSLKKETKGLLALEGDTLFNLDSQDSFIGKAALSIANKTATAKTISNAIQDTDKVRYNFENIGNNIDQRVQAVDTAGKAALEFLSEYAYDLFNEKVPTTLRALIAEPAAAAGALIGAGAGKKGLVTVISGRLNDLGQSILRDMAGIPEVEPVVSQIRNWLKLLETLEAGANSVEDIQEIIKALEPVLPLVSSVADLALGFWSGGTTIAKNVQTLVERAQIFGQQALAALILMLRSFILGMEVNVPKILVVGASLLDYNAAFAYVDELKKEASEGEIEEEKLHWALSMLTESNAKFIKNIGLYDSTMRDTLLNGINVKGINISEIDWKSKDLWKNLTDTFVVNFTNAVLYSFGITPIPSNSYKTVWFENNSSGQNNNNESGPPPNTGTETLSLNENQFRGIFSDAAMTEYQILSTSFLLSDSYKEGLSLMDKLVNVF